IYPTDKSLRAQYFSILLILALNHATDGYTNTLTNIKYYTMKRKIYTLQSIILFTFFFINFNLHGQCPPDNKFYAITQQDVDDFIINYPNCTSLQQLNIGDLGPAPWQITDLSPFTNLINVDDLSILEITAQSLQGLNNLQTVESLFIYAMQNLTSLEGLENLQSVTGYSFRIGLCTSITNLNGLENLTNVNVNEFIIDNNPNLNDIDGLNCYFFSQGFRNTVTNYSVQENLYQSIFDNCNINLSNDNFTFKDIIIYPNPAQSYVTLENIENIKQIDIFDLSGKLIKKKNLDFENIDVSNLSKGTYIMKITLDSNLVFNNELIIE
ncbi:putative secreted protein (Por secretion system target), partial [Mesonia algae]